MTPIQKQIHQEAVRLGAAYQRADWPLIRVLQQVQIHKVFGEQLCKNLFTYATKHMGMNDAQAGAFTTVAKKGLELPALTTAIRERRLQVAKAVRMTAVLTEKNVDEMIEFASHCTYLELDEKCAELNPKKKKRGSRKASRKGWIRFSADLKKETVALLDRVMELANKKKNEDEDDVIAELAAFWLERRDPVQKAERAAERKAKRAPAGDSHCAHNVKPAHKRAPLTAQQIHAVNVRDRGQCVFVGENGERCCEKRYLKIHHVVEVSKGGTNDPSNLRTLCAFHHDLVHQLSFPIDMQFNWIHPPVLQANS